jgi:hypothetical protein
MAEKTLVLSSMLKLVSVVKAVPAPALRPVMKASLTFRLLALARLLKI